MKAAMHWRKNLVSSCYRNDLFTFVKLKLVQYLSDDSGEMTAQLTRLLRDETTDNCSLLLEIIAGGGANKRLNGYLFGIAVAHKQADIQNRALDLLKKFTSPDTVQQAVRLKNAVNYYHNEAEYLGKYKNPEFDLFDFLLAYKMCNWHGIQNNSYRSERYRLSFDTLNLASYPEIQISSAIETLDFVRYIILPHNKDFDLDHAFQHLIKLPLESIYIENVRLLEFPHRFFEFPKLKVLSIKRGTYRPRHPMEAQDVTPSGCDTLEKFIVDGYPMSKTERLGPFPNLKTGYFVRCGLEDLPFLEGSPNLEELNIKFNQLTELPAFLSECAQMRTLELSGNPFEKITLDLSKMNKLEELELKMKIERTTRYYW